jgi:hypothetical protein
MTGHLFANLRIGDTDASDPRTDGDGNEHNTVTERELKPGECVFSGIVEENRSNELEHELVRDNCELQFGTREVGASLEHATGKFGRGRDDRDGYSEKVGVGI